MAEAADSAIDDLSTRAYAAIDRGALREAAELFGILVDRKPGNDAYHYMRGLAHKYLGDWTASLHDNLRAIALSDTPDMAAIWNAGIAATAIGDWAQARSLWALANISIPPGDGPIEGNFGVCSIRLNAWSGGETLFARRIDVVRARLLNVPLPESGYRFGDLVLHDGAPTGRRSDGDREVPVFNALARLQTSLFRTFVAFVDCDDAAALRDLLDASAPGIGFCEDWTGNMVNYCLRCSYGTPHRREDAHDGSTDAEWSVERNVGIAAQSRHSAEKLLADWVARGAGRRVDALDFREHDIPDPEDGHVWWRGPED